MPDYLYGLFHIFEAGLKKATSNTMCADLGYTAYESTVTHGFGPLKITLDLYNPTTPKESEVVEESKVGETSILASSVTKEAQPCCSVCSDPKNKYYSIASGLFGDKHCGECCMQDKDYTLYHFFEKNLLKADSATPCKDQGYSVYSTTVTHGFGPVKMTLDLYNPDAKPVTAEKIYAAPIETPEAPQATSPFVYIVPSFLGGVALAAAAVLFGKKTEKKIDVDTHHLLA